MVVAGGGWYLLVVAGGGWWWLVLAGGGSYSLVVAWWLVVSGSCMPTTMLACYHTRELFKSRRCARVDFPPMGSHEEHLTGKAFVFIVTNLYKISPF